MKNTEYGITLVGEFKDEELEKEFLECELKKNSNIIGLVSIIYGIMYLSFILFDYLSMGNTESFRFILIIRLLFMMLSAAVYLDCRSVTNKNIAYLITAYEIFAAIAFLLILNQYETLTFLSFLSLIAINCAIFIMPNRFIYVQTVVVVLNVLFFMFPARHIQNIDNAMLLKVILYDVMIIAFSSIGFCTANSCKRKQYADDLELLRLSVTDPLTGIYNRVKFNEELMKWTEYSRRYKTPLSLVFLDIDNFKRVNDSCGHMVGDMVIKEIVSSISSKIRNTDIFARWGGEEFVILLPGTGIDSAVDMAERMRADIQSSRYGEAGKITCSFGLAMLRDNEDSESFLQRGDSLLYEAKKCGKNRVAFERRILEEA